MGLIDEIRKKRDSWIKRFEEQRIEEEEYDFEYEIQNKSKIEEEILNNRKKVGVFDLKKMQNNNFD